jgi:hypothetical protein
VITPLNLHRRDAEYAEVTQRVECPITCHLLYQVFSRDNDE